MVKDLNKVFAMIAKMTRGAPACPRCGATQGDGFFILEKPIIFRLWFVKLHAILKLIYCPRCGLLQLRFAGIQVEGTA